MRVPPIVCVMLLLALTSAHSAERRLEGAVDVAHANPERGFCYLVSQKFPCPGDTMEGEASILRVFEDGKELGPPHSMHEDVRTRGKGAFSHWYDSLYLSSSDNTDPRTNGRKYTYCVSMSEEEIADALDAAFRGGCLQLRLNKISEPFMSAPVTAIVSVQDRSGNVLLPPQAFTLPLANWVVVPPSWRMPSSRMRLTIEIPLKAGEPIKVTRDLYPPRAIPLEVCSTNWTATTKGKWKDRPDSRGLRGMLHPWEFSETGASAQVTRQVRLPSDWVGPVLLQFHVSDNYVGVGYKKDQGAFYVGSDIFLNHRFKRVLVNDAVVWESDVADDLEPTYFSVDLSKHVKPGQTFRLTLRVDDVVSSKEKLPGDDHFGWTWDPKEIPTRETANRSPEIDEKFESNVYWGDGGLTNDAGDVKDTNIFAPRPSQLKIPPWRPPHKLTAPRTVALNLETPGDLPSTGFPVTCGVPFGPGELTDEHSLQLLSPDGNAVPLQTKVLGKWPDGSIKWVLFDFIATSAKPHTLQFGPGVARAPVTTRLTVAENQGNVTITTGSFDVSIGTDVSKLMNNVTASLTESGHTCRFLRESAEILEGGPIRASVKLSGHVTDGATSLGRFTAHVEARAGMPFVRLFLRVFNDSGRILKVSDLSLTVPARTGAVTDFGVGDTPLGVPASLQQVAWKHFDVRDSKGVIVTNGERAPGWVSGHAANLDVPRTLLAVRDFYQQFPKALEATPEGLTARLFSPTKEEPFYEPTMGEAKGHELLIGTLPANVSPKEVAEAFQNPPRLFNRDYFCETGGLGDVAVHDETHFPAFHEAAKSLQSELNLDGRGKGIRHFPDTYSGAATGAFVDSWMNFYHDTFHGMCREYLMTGDRRWFDLAQASSRHYMDVDIIHHWPANPNLIGLPHGTGSNHTGHDPYSLIAHLNGLVDLYFLTGDPDAWEAAVGVGEGIMRNNYGFGGSSRDTGWPMQGIGRLYRETRDPKYLNYLHRLVKCGNDFTMLRRGTYHEGHGSLSYRGQVPFMNAILGRGLMFVVQDTGDKDAAFLLVQIAKSLSIESQQQPGWFNYSPNPHQRGRLTNYNFLLVPMLLYACEISGDHTLLDTALAAFDQAVEQKSFWLGGYFNAGEMLHLLNTLAPNHFALSPSFDYTLMRSPTGWTVDLDGSRTASTSGKVISWNWDLSGTKLVGQKVNHNLLRGGTIKVTLTARDEKQNVKSATKTLQLPPAPGDFGLPQWGLVVRTEAETFVKQSGGSVQIRDDKLAASGKSLSHWNSKGHSVEWNADIPADGDYFLMIRYATPENAARVLTVDGQVQPLLRCPSSGGYGSAAADNWGFAILKGDDGKPVTLHLPKGAHVVRLENRDGTGLNVDYLEWVRR